MNEEFERLKKAIEALPEEQQKESMMNLIEKLLVMVKESPKKAMEAMEEKFLPWAKVATKFDVKDIEIAKHMSNKNNQLKTLYRKGLGSTLVTEKIKNMEENTGLDIRDVYDWMKEKHIVPS